MLIMVIATINSLAVDYNSDFKSWNPVPTTVYTGQKYNVWVAFQNTGTMSWSSADNIKLGGANPRGNTTWGLGRVNMGSQVVTPGQTYYFYFTVTAPSTPGTYNFQWQMLKEYVKWFGDYTPNRVVNVVRPARDANFVSQSVPLTMEIGTSYPVWVKFENTGSNTWTAANNYSLGSQSPQDNLNWGLGRVNLSSSDSIATGQSKTFSFVVTPPEDPGSYKFQWRMLQEGVTWFGDYSSKKTITVSRPQLGARFVSQDVPTVMEAGETREVTVTFKNLGSETWGAVGAGISMGSQNPANNVTWGRERVYIFETVDPGETKDFVFDITAPTTGGDYNFKWRMVKENVTWFGNYSQNVVIHVNEPVTVTLDTTNLQGSLNGTVPINIDISGNASKTEFYVDGCLYDSVDTTLTGQYTFNWDTTCNHLPTLDPTRQMDYMYYGPLGLWLEEGADQRCGDPEAVITYYSTFTMYCHADYTHHVNGYTNAFFAYPALYKPNMYYNDPEYPEADGAWQYWMAQDIAAQVGDPANPRNLELGFNLGQYLGWASDKQLYIDEIIEMARPFWDSVSRIEIADEPYGKYNSLQDLQDDFDAVELAIQNKGLPAKPMGVTLKINSPYYQPANNLFTTTNLDWVGVEGYIDLESASDSDVNIEALRNTLANDMSRVPADKDIVIAMMAFARRSFPGYPDFLRDLQIPTYLIAQSDSRVVGINMFAFLRKPPNSGPYFLPDLKTPHKLIWETIKPASIPQDITAGNGPRTLIVKVYNSSGNSQKVYTVVNVAN